MIDISITYKEVLEDAKRRIYVYNNELRQAQAGQLLTINMYNEHLVKQIVSESIDNIISTAARYISSVSYKGTDVSITLRSALTDDVAKTLQHIIVAASAVTAISKITTIAQIQQSCTAIADSNRQTMMYVLSHNRQHTERKDVTKIDERKKLKYE